MATPEYLPSSANGDIDEDKPTSSSAIDALPNPTSNSAALTNSDEEKPETGTSLVIVPEHDVLPQTREITGFKWFLACLAMFSANLLYGFVCPLPFLLSQMLPPIKLVLKS
jgi:hypothetical protein